MKTTQKSLPLLQIHCLNKHFGQTHVLRDISLELHSGEILFLLGASGCGKTTLLRAIAGFEQPDNGEIYLKERLIFGVNCNIPPQQRRLGYVVQEGVLFPHLNVYRNIAYGLGDGKGRSPEERQRIDEVMALTGICALADRFPHQLSGGQQQRIAIARAVVNKPKVLLLDESLSALDYKLRKQMQYELKQLQRQLGITFIFVTHDQEEAITMSDRIVLLRKGKIAQDGSPREIYEDPANLFVARFIGEINVFDATVIERKSDDVVLANVEGRICDIYTDIPVEKDQQLQVLLRPEDIVIEELDEHEHSNAIIGHIIDRTYKGMTLESTVEFEHNGKRVLVSEFFNEDDPHMDHSIGQRVGITWHEGWEVVLNDEDNQ